MPISKVKTGSITDSAVTSAKIQDGSIVNADINACAAIASSKLTVDTSALETDINTNKFNISLLGFKMAVNEGLTVFNLVDGVVDEFNDESGTDEAEGSNDLYCGTSDYYINSTTPGGASIPAVSAGFTTSSITEPDTSVAGTNPTAGSGTFGSFTVPCGISSVNVYLWGAGGSGDQTCKSGGGGFTSGSLAVSGSQVLEVVVGEGVFDGSPQDTSGNPTASEPPLGNAAQSLGGGRGAGPSGSAPANVYSPGSGGGLSGIFTNCEGFSCLQLNACKAPQVYMVAGGGGGGGGAPGGGGGAGGLTGFRGCESATTNGATLSGSAHGGGGDQEQGGQAGPGNDNGPTAAGGATGGFLKGGHGRGDIYGGDGVYHAGGGGGYYGGGGGGYKSDPSHGGGGGGSSYYGHPQITCGATTAGESGGPTGGGVGEGGGVTSPFYVAGTNEGATNTGTPHLGDDGYVLFSAAAVCASTTSTTIVSTAFTSTSVPTSARIVVFEENVDTPTLNTDIVASISRDGTNFTNATLSDSGYVTGSSGQRILTGQADISGQPSGQSMRWKLALANNTVKIHGVSLQWS